MDTDTQTIATFRGTLLRREHAVGQKFVQLVFREDDRNWLCISSKLQNSSLQIGQDYQVEGIFKQVGERSFIQDPEISLYKTRQRRRSGRRRLLFTGITVGVLLASGGAVFALRGSTAQPLQATNTATHASVQQSATTTDATPAATQAATPDTTTPVATTPAATTTSTTKKKAATPAATPIPAATTPQQTASTAYCDTAVTIPIVYDDVIDDSDPPGTLSGGTAGQSQTCYDDASGANPVTTVLSTMVHGTRAVASTQQ